MDASAVEVLLKNTNDNFDSTDGVNNKSLADEGVLDTTTDSEAGDIESLSSVLTEASTETVRSKSVKDPNRPRYTRKEMEDVLEQRNRFKIEKLALEEELELYKREERDRYVDVFLRLLKNVQVIQIGEQSSSPPQTGCNPKV